MALTTISSDVLIVGSLSSKTFSPPAGCINDTAIAAPSAPASAIATSKVRHRFEPFMAQPNTTATTETKTVHVVRGTAGTINEVVAGSIVACIGGATITLDVKKNGSSVLTGVLTLNSSNTARVAVPASLSGGSVTVAAGDWIEFVVTATTGGGTIGTGFFAQLQIDEDPS